ncbi:exonuclease domain-containing protein [Agromyces sp. M3QZ16-3]|uniref:exonuclease domain-containing protein n=1 Tax=Agromyces sp. M3QZ16-3 TaxID=3447585 RepID=UPI003F691DC5
MSFFDRLFGRADRRKSAPSHPTAGDLLQQADALPRQGGDTRQQATITARQAVPSFAVIDVETTGLSPKAGRVLELAVVRVDARGAVIDEWTSRFNPEGPVGATHIHGITAADVADAPLFHEVAGTIVDRLGGLPVAAHNAKFDLAFLRSEFTLAGWDMPWLPSFCTLHGSYHYLPDMHRRRLADCCWATGVPLSDAHSALGDARAAAGLLRYYLDRAAARDVHGDLVGIFEQARAVSWPDGPVRTPRSRPASAQPTTASTRMSASRPAQPPLLEQLTGLSLLEALDEGAPEGTMTYLEALLEALEDGEVSEDEAVILNDYASIYQLDVSDIRAANRAFVLALAHRAVDDGHVSRDERAQLNAIAELLDVDQDSVLEIVKHADEARAARLGQGLQPLSEDWSHGEPLRVGDKVAFTGCDDAVRDRLERRAGELGIRVMGNVSRFTAMLVTDGSFTGGKLKRAHELSTRIVDPATFEMLLKHVQPALATPPAASEVEGAGTPAPSQRDREVAPSSVVATTAAYSGPSPAVIRQWALENGYSVGVRGRLPREVLEAFSAAGSAAG